MKIIGKTPEGDLIIQVSQAEWDGLGDGIRPKEDKWERWKESEIYRLLPKDEGYGGMKLRFALWSGTIDGSIRSLQDVVSGKIRVSGIGPDKQARLKTLLDNHTAQTEEKP